MGLTADLIRGERDAVSSLVPTEYAGLSISLANLFPTAAILSLLNKYNLIQTSQGQLHRLSNHSITQPCDVTKSVKLS